MADDLSLRISRPHSPDQRQQRPLLSLRPRVAGLIIVVDAPDIAYRDRPIVHIALWTVLPTLIVRADPLVASVKMNK